MARFKKISYFINKKKHETWISVDSSGIFSCTVPNYISTALGIDGELSGRDAIKLEHAFLKHTRAYARLVETSVYRIKYRIAFSNRIKDQLPSSVMTDDAWRATRRIGGEYMPENAISIIIDWFPIVTSVKGKEESDTKLKLPEEGDYYITGAEKAIQEGKDAEFYLMNIHKPYDGILLVADSTHWEFDEQKYVYKSIPLTKETFEFFTNIEAGFISMLSKLFAFLSRDEKLLMADILKMIESNTFKQIGL